MGICGAKQVKIQDSQPITHSSLPAPSKTRENPQVTMRKIDQKKALEVPVLSINTSKIYQRRKQHSDNKLVPPEDISPKHSFTGT